MQDYPHTWALVRQASIEAYVYESILTNESWEPQTIWSYYLVQWDDQPNGTIKQTETLCAMESSEIVVTTKLGTERWQQTVVPQTVVDSVPPATWSATLTVTEDADAEGGECPVVYSLNDTPFGPQYWVFGAHLNDPATETCPSSEDDPAEYDQDQDGHPGVTTQQWVNGELNANIYVCSRTLYRFEPGLVSEIEGEGYRIQGKMVDVVIDQTMFGSDNATLDGMDPESRWSPNDLTYYILVQLPDDATCADVTSDLFYQGA